MKILVIYLFRNGDSVENKKKFLASYDNHPAGCEHDFYVIYKGFELAHCKNIIDFGYDLYSYRKIAKENPQYTHFVFFNSHTEIIKDNWLRLMTEFGPDIVVGTSSSHESFYTNAINKGPHWLNWLRKLLYYPYPNFHIRTNGIFISRELMMKYWSRFLITKQLCYIFESGKNNLTNRLNRDNKKIAVVKGLISDNRTAYVSSNLVASSHY